MISHKKNEILKKTQNNENVSFKASYLRDKNFLISFLAKGHIVPKNYNSLEEIFAYISKLKKYTNEDLEFLGIYAFRLGVPAEVLSTKMLTDKVKSKYYTRILDEFLQQQMSIDSFIKNLNVLKINPCQCLKNLATEHSKAVLNKGALDTKIDYIIASELINKYGDSYFETISLTLRLDKELQRQTVEQVKLSAKQLAKKLTKEELESRLLKTKDEFKSLIKEAEDNKDIVELYKQQKKLAESQKTIVENKNRTQQEDKECVDNLINEFNFQNEENTENE